MFKNSGESSSLLEAQLSKCFSQKIRQDVRAVYSRSGIIQLMLLIKLMIITTLHRFLDPITGQVPNTRGRATLPGGANSLALDAVNAIGSTLALVIGHAAFSLEHPETQSTPVPSKPSVFYRDNFRQGNAATRVNEIKAYQFITIIHRIR